jgi:hypothetical protein
MGSQAAQNSPATGLHIRAQALRVRATRLKDLVCALVTLLAPFGELSAASLRELILVVLQALDSGAPSRLHVHAQPIHVVLAGVACGVRSLLPRDLESEEDNDPRRRDTQQSSREIVHESSLGKTANSVTRLSSGQEAFGMR